MVLRPNPDPDVKWRMLPEGEARVIVGSRAVIEHAFEPIRQLRENLKR
jgi:hypothetical protein